MSGRFEIVYIGILMGERKTAFQPQALYNSPIHSEIISHIIVFFLIYRIQRGIIQRIIKRLS